MLNSNHLDVSGFFFILRKKQKAADPAVAWLSFFFLLARRGLWITEISLWFGEQFSSVSLCSRKQPRITGGLDYQDFFFF